MGKVLITGSADGLGRLTAQQLVQDGHDVVLHARDAGRARDAMAAVPGAVDALVGDLASIAAVRGLAESADAVGRFDAVIHNAVSADPGATVSGRCFHHRREVAPAPVATRVELQDALLEACAELTGVAFPAD